MSAMFSYTHTILQSGQQGDEAGIQHVSVILQTNQVTVEHPAELQQSTQPGPAITTCATTSPTRSTNLDSPSLCRCTSPPLVSLRSWNIHRKKVIKAVAGIGGDAAHSLLHLSMISAMNWLAACACSPGGPGRNREEHSGGRSTLGTGQGWNGFIRNILHLIRSRQTDLPGLVCQKSTADTFILYLPM